ncbi:MAG: S8 family serine peptidase [Gemmatimonadetes bacterium]|nr:S8 family serine peptidase [Gemmatimonadota bacterium]
MTAFCATGAFAADYVPGELVVRIPPGGNVQAIHDAWGTQTLEQLSLRSYVVTPPAGVNVEDCDQWLDADSNVESADPNWITESPEAKSAIIIVAIGSSTTQYTDQGAFARIGLAEAHQYSTGQGVRIALLDTGIDPSHPVFQGKLIAGYDFVDDDADPSEIATGVDEDGDGLTDEGFGHGTMVAGVIAASVPDAEILPIRVLDDEGSGTLASLIRGIDYAVSRGAQIINMSVGLAFESEPLENAVSDAEDAGALLVAAAGNENTPTEIYPASFGQVLSVTALDSNDVKASFSSYNEEVDVAAPGDGIYSTYPGGTYARGSGTSFAAPFVTGAAALLFSAGTPGEPGDLAQSLTDSVVVVDSLAGNAPFAGNLGQGRLDVESALTGYLAEQATSVDGAFRPYGVQFFASPNPFRGATTIRLSTPAGTTMPHELEIYSLQGRRVRTIRSDSSDRGAWEWNGLDDRGRHVSAGVYLIRSNAGSLQSVGRLVHIR